MKNLYSTCLSEKGAIAIVYAIVFPVLLAAVAFALDSSLALNRKARLADASSEAILAIAAIDNRLVDDEALNANKTIAKKYISYYLPDNNKQKMQLSISVTDNISNDGFVDYSLIASVNTPTLLPLENLGFPSFKKTVNIGNYGDNSGNARKFITINDTPADYVFVVDFSDTMNLKYTGSDGQVTTRLNMLKKVVNDVISGSKHTNSQFAIIPFDLGVPFKVEDAVNGALPYKTDKNEAGGELIGCSTLYVPRDKYSPANIDYAFWANKQIMQVEYPNYDSGKNTILYNIDRSRYMYYRFIVGEATGEDIGDMQQRGWCTQNPQNGVPLGVYLFSCEKVSNQSIFTHLNLQKIGAQYGAVVDLANTMRGSPSLERSSIFNSITVDYSETLKAENLFSPDHIQEFIQPWAPNMYEYRAFTGMCQSATPLYTVSDLLSQEQAEKNMAATMESASPHAFLIPLTTSKAEKEKLVSDFIGMGAGGGTDSSAGLLRSVPIIAAGKNKKKVIIVISDGEDEVDPAIVSKELHSRGMCDVIKSGLKSESLYADNRIAVVAETTEIHYVSINDDHTNAERIAFWGKYCAKGESESDSTQYVHTATDYSSLINTLKSIIGVETGYYIRDDQK